MILSRTVAKVYDKKPISRIFTSHQEHSHLIRNKKNVLIIKTVSYKAYTGHICLTYFAGRMVRNKMYGIQFLVYGDDDKILSQNLSRSA
jgi:hypothetical protein